MSDVASLTFEADGPGQFDVLAAFSGVTFTAPPFVLLLHNDSAGTVADEVVVPPSEGESLHTMHIPSAGLFEFSINWTVPEFTMPAGDSSFGIGAYSFRAFSINVLEPTTFVTAACAMTLTAGFLSRKRR